jgi:sec-independent protein translocase protein TatA
MLGLDNPLHILLVLVVVLLVFGAKRLPEMGKSLGEGIRGFKSSIGDEHDDLPGQRDSGTTSMNSLDEAAPAPVVADSSERTTESDRTPQPVA